MTALTSSGIDDSDADDADWLGLNERSAVGFLALP